MKRTLKNIVIGILMVALILGTAAIAEIDLSGMTDEEINTLIEAAEEELSKRNEDKGKDTDGYLVCDFHGMTITATDFRVDEDGYLVMTLLTENNSEEYDYKLLINMGHYSINGWETKGSQTKENLLTDFFIGKGSKLKRDMKLDMELANVETVEEIENIRFSFEVHVSPINKDVYSEPITINLK